MKRNFLLVILVIFCCFSCAKEEDEEENPQPATDIIKNDPSLSLFYEYLQHNEYLSFLDTGSYTILAPVNSSIENQTLTESQIAKHIIKGNYTIDKLKSTSVKDINNATVNVDYERDTLSYDVHQFAVTEKDIIKNKIIIHKIKGFYGQEEIVPDDDKIDTKEKAIAGIQACYDELGSVVEHFIVLGELRGDLLETANTGVVSINDFSVVANNESNKNIFLDLIHLVITCNKIIYDVPAISFSEQEKLHIISEAKYIRALANFYLVRSYQNVPLLQEGEDLSEGSQDTRANMITAIETDLTDAIESLPAVASSKSKISKFAANALLAEVYLSNNKYSECENVCKSIINGQNFSLASSFSNIFSVGGTEIIFEISINKSEASSLKKLFYDDKKYVPTSSALQLWESNDSRKSVSIDAASTRVSKYNRSGDDNTWIQSRYADILLMNAECNEALGKSMEAIELINMVRLRAGLQQVSYQSSAETKVLILEERARELAFEGKRWFDLVRFGDKTYVIDKIAGSFPSSKQADVTNKLNNEYIWILPIPQQVLDLYPNYFQNPGY